MTQPWYKKGLRFGCTQCGKCCTGEPGYVWITFEEAEKMAAFLKIPTEKFFETYTRQVDGEFALKEDPRSYDCIFLRDGMCRVYGNRPKQCSTFPFWPENLESKEAWEKAKQRCEGIDHEDAPVIPLEQILGQLAELDEEIEE